MILILLPVFSREPGSLNALLYLYVWQVKFVDPQHFKGDLKKKIFMYVVQHCFIYRPSDSTVSEDAGIELRTVVIFALTTRLDLASRFSSPTLCIVNDDPVM